MDKITIKNLLLRGIIGINPEERVKKQDILVNVELWADTRPAAASDAIEDAVNYKEISKRVIAHVETATDFLVEKLANDIATMILVDFHVERVRVRVEKPGALRFAESVGVEVERRPSDLA